MLRRTFSAALLATAAGRAAAQAASSAAPAAPAAPATPTTPAPSAAPAVVQTPAAAPMGKWTRDAYIAAMQASGRPHEISAGAFEAIQKRKDAALKSIERYLAQRFGKADPAVLKGFVDLPREYYHYQYAEKRSIAGDTYESEAKPWAIGFGSALSDYLGQAYMTQALQSKPTDTVLEIGTGSGFQSSLLSRIVKSVYSIEIIEPLGKAVANIYKPLGITNVTTKVGDGFYGWPEVQGGFDSIIVTCAAQFVPPALFKQLKPGGRMLIPIGQPFKRGQFLFIYSKDADGKVTSRKDVGVFFIPMTGAMMKGQAASEPRP